MNRPAPLTEHDIRCLGVLLRFNGPVVIAAQYLCPHGQSSALGTLYGSVSERAIDRHYAEYARVQALTALRLEPPI